MEINEENHNHLNKKLLDIIFKGNVFSIQASNNFITTESLSLKKNNIYQLLRLNPHANSYEKFLKHNINILISALEKISIKDILEIRHSINNLAHNYHINKEISGQIIEYINAHKNKNNIHLLLILHPESFGYCDLLDNKDIITLLVEKLKEISIKDILNSNYIIKNEITNKIIEYAENQLEEIINILPILNSNAYDYNNSIKEENTIELLIKKLKEIEIKKILEFKDPINQKISKKIIKYMLKNKNENNMHPLLILHPETSGYDEIIINNIDLFFISQLQKISICERFSILTTLLETKNNRLQELKNNQEIRTLYQTIKTGLAIIEKEKANEFKQIFKPIDVKDILKNRKKYFKYAEMEDICNKKYFKNKKKYLEDGDTRHAQELKLVFSKKSIDAYSKNIDIANLNDVPGQIFISNLR